MRRVIVVKYKNEHETDFGKMFCQSKSIVDVKRLIQILI